MKKLIPALCMLLVAAALLGTSTFAWFSMNTNVEATGMTVKAVTSTNLFIAALQNGGTFTGFGVSANTTVAAAEKMNPVTSADGKGFYALNAGYKGSAYDNSALVDSTGNSVTELTSAVFTTDKKDDTNYVYKTQYKLATENGASSKFAGFYVSGITVTNNGDDLAPALRVAVKVGETVKIYAPLDTATTPYKSWNGTAQVDDVAPITTFTNADKFDVEIGTQATGAVTVDVYVWFEGQDAACTSGAAAVQTSNYGVVIDFTAIAA